MYTEKFKERVLTLYPDDEHIYNLLQEGQWALGRELRIGAEFATVDHCTIIDAPSLEWLQQKSIEWKLKQQLYSDFIETGGGKDVNVPCRIQVHELLSREKQQLMVKSERSDNGTGKS